MLPSVYPIQDYIEVLHLYTCPNPTPHNLGCWIGFTLIKLLRKKSTEFTVFRKAQKGTFTEIRLDDKRLINISLSVESCNI